jgi:NAD(P)-dependent dehydrogenase (short-subunit alcohol dehydrogenase family)
VNVLQAPSKKTALVTGAGKRLGRAIALGMAQQGWDIVVHYRHSATEAEATVNDIHALGRRAEALQCDLTQEAAVRQLLPQAIKKMGAITCVVNSASLFEYDDAASFNQSNLDAHVHTNLAAPILLAQALHAATALGEQAVVINLLDQKLFNPNPDFLSYTLSKSALHAATTLLAQALAPTVRVVGLAPGLTLVSGDQTAEGFTNAHQQTPLGKSSTPEDIVSAVCYLASATAVTGTTLLVDGGQHLLPLQRDVMFLAK